jgi:hypothetical protein
LQLPQQPSKLPAEQPASHSRPLSAQVTPVEQASALLEPTPSPDAAAASPGAAEETPRPPAEPRLPKQASLRLPPRRASTDRSKLSPQSAGSPSEAGAPSQTASPPLAGPVQMQRSGTLPCQMPGCKPPLAPLTLLKSISLPAGQEGHAAAALAPPLRQLNPAVKEEAAAAAPLPEKPAVGPDGWRRGLALYTQVWG